MKTICNHAFTEKCLLQSHPMAFCPHCYSHEYNEKIGCNLECNNLIVKCIPINQEESK
jgi:hypothetical protein